MTSITGEQLSQLGIQPSWAEPLAATFEKYEINTAARRAAFLGQCSVESGNFEALQENLNYSAQGLQNMWPGRFPNVEDAERYQRQPEKIANKVYADRMGNGSESSGDGYRYRGRGLVQLTGKDNYRQAGEALGADFVARPDLVATQGYAALTAGWFWKAKSLNKLADEQDHETITKRINGGTTHLQDRIARTKRAMTVLTGKP